MKPIITFFCLLIMMSCASQKTKETSMSKKNEVSSNKVLEVCYEARSRGSIKQVQLIGNTCVYKNNTESKKVILSSKDEKELKRLLSLLEVEEIKYLKAPTDKRMIDGSMHAVVKIKEGVEEYSSANFDDGNPPVELQPLVDFLMKIVQ